jgi:hypothetical protein
MLYPLLRRINEHLVRWACRKYKRLVEAAVIADPALHDAVEHPREVGEGLVTAPGDVPGPHFPAHRLDGVLADCREEVHEVLPPFVLGQPRAERVPQECERRDLMIATPAGVLTVHHAGLARMQFQAGVRQPRGQGIAYLHGLRLAAAVNNRIITVTLKCDARVFPGQPAAFPAPGHRIQRRPPRAVTMGIAVENGFHQLFRMHGYHRLRDPVSHGGHTPGF